ncbi:MAG: DNA-processing protein DprA [Acidimicrobiia bacterium]
MTIDATREWLALSSVQGIGPARLKQLLRRFDSPTGVLQAPAAELNKCRFLSEQQIRTIGQADTLRRAADIELDKLALLGGRVLTLADKAYPALLRQTAQPPPVLFVRGRTELLCSPSVAIVGSRAATSYGRRVSFHLARELANHSLCVVSGLALGIDAEAHAGCLAGGGDTIGVLGCGLDVVYPGRNRSLYAAIAERGLLVSEYPLGTRPEPFRFPARNRIIAGLSSGVVVVEASRKSGSLITVQYGLEEGREIFCVPGQIDSVKSSGTHWLLQQGASLIVGADDIVEQLSLQQPETANAAERADISEPSSGAAAGLDREGAALLSIIESYPQTRTELLQRSALSTARLSELLLVLELDGLVEILPGDQIRKRSSFE